MISTVEITAWDRMQCVCGLAIVVITDLEVAELMCAISARKRSCVSHGMAVLSVLVDMV